MPLQRADQRADGELAALRVDYGVCYSFTNTATCIWSLIAPKRVSEIRDVLLREYGVERAAWAQLRVR